MENRASLKTKLGSLHLGAAPITALQENLMPEEARILNGMSAVSAQSTVAGRTLARRLLKEMRLPLSSIPRDLNGAPVWPEGLCGSISHSRTRAAVALGFLADWSSLGIDIVDE